MRRKARGRGFRAAGVRKKGVWRKWTSAEKRKGGPSPYCILLCVRVRRREGAGRTGTAITKSKLHRIKTRLGEKKEKARGGREVLIAQKVERE